MANALYHTPVLSMCSSGAEDGILTPSRLDTVWQTPAPFGDATNYWTSIHIYDCQNKFPHVTVNGGKVTHFPSLDVIRRQDTSFGAEKNEIHFHILIIIVCFFFVRIIQTNNRTSKHQRVRVVALLYGSRFIHGTEDLTTECFFGAPNLFHAYFPRQWGDSSGWNDKSFLAMIFFYN